MLLGLDLAPLWLALVPALLACLWALRQLQAPSGPVPPPAAERRAHDAARAALALRHARCQEELRGAERAWSAVAGDVDGGAVDDVVNRTEPQHGVAEAVAAQDSDVRASAGDTGEQRLRWASAWRSLGRPAPGPLDAQAAVARLAEQLTRPLVVVGPAIARAAELARVAPSAPVIVLDDEVLSVPSALERSAPEGAS